MLTGGGVTPLENGEALAGSERVLFGEAQAKWGGVAKAGTACALKTRAGGHVAPAAARPLARTRVSLVDVPSKADG